MPHRVTRHAEADLDDIWYYVAKESASMDVANHLVDSLTDRFLLLARFPYLGRNRDKDLAQDPGYVPVFLRLTSDPY